MNEKKTIKIRKWEKAEKWVWSASCKSNWAQSKCQVGRMNGVWWRKTPSLELARPWTEEQTKEKKWQRKREWKIQRKHLSRRWRCSRFYFTVATTMPSTTRKRMTTLSFMYTKIPKRSEATRKCEREPRSNGEKRTKNLTIFAPPPIFLQKHKRRTLE